jgi:hypothetical protein
MWKLRALAEYRPEEQTNPPRPPAISVLLSYHNSFDVDKQIIKLVLLVMNLKKALGYRINFREAAGFRVGSETVLRNIKK